MVKTYHQNLYPFRRSTPYERQTVQPGLADLWIVQQDKSRKKKGKKQTLQREIFHDNTIVKDIEYEPPTVIACI